jgi:hypothetical protein
MSAQMITCRQCGRKIEARPKTGQGLHVCKFAPNGQRWGGTKAPCNGFKPKEEATNARG